MKTRPSLRQAGFTLTEILVAMIIALIGIVMMFQILEVSETRKRTTGAGSDAQVAGSIAMYSLERDLRGAGNGFGGAGLPAVASLGCMISAHDEVRGAGAAGDFLFPMVPVLIEDGAAGAPDKVTAFYGNADVAAQALSFTASTANTKNMDYGARGGLVQGDLLLIVSNGACTLVELTDNSNVNGVTIDHATGSYVRHYPARKVGIANDADYEYVTGAAPVGNPTARYNSATGTPAATTGTLFNLGRRDQPRRNIWQISSNNLTVTDALHNGSALAVGDNVIDLQAEYGLSTSTPITWQASAPADWSKVVAVRVALLTRSQQYEKENVNANSDGSDKPPTWTNLNDASAPYPFAMTNVDGTADVGKASLGVNNWRNYRYRVYETVIPVRNSVWGGT